MKIEWAEGEAKCFNIYFFRFKAKKKTLSAAVHFLLLRGVCVIPGQCQLAHSVSLPASCAAYGTAF